MAGVLACVKIYDLKSNGKLLYEKEHLMKERGQNVPWCLVGIINPCAVVVKSLVLCKHSRHGNDMLF